MMCIGVVQVPFAPTYGWATKLATPAWFVTSAGEAMRTGACPSIFLSCGEFLSRQKRGVWLHGS
jgi:hypothetical protein